MGSFGSQSAPSPQQQPNFNLGNFYSPYGNLQTNGNNTVYQPFLTPAETSAFNTRNQMINNTLGQIPSGFNVNDAFNNPFYSSTYDLMAQPIQQQQATDQQNLTNSMNAQNQLGSSYAAMSQDLLNRRYDTLYQNAQNQARMNSMDAYNQNFQNNLDLLNNLQGGQTALMNMLYAPAQVGEGLQRNTVGMTSAMGSYYPNMARIGLGQQLANTSMLGSLLPLGAQMFGSLF